MLTRRQLLVSSFGFAGGLLLVSCGSPTSTPQAPVQPVATAQPTSPAPTPNAPVSGSKIEIRLWHGFTGGDNVEQTNKMVAGYNQVNTDNITVKVDAFTWADVFAKYAASFRAGTPPDIVYLVASAVADFATRGILLELTPELEKEVGGLPWNEHYPVARQVSSYKGKQWMIALDLITNVPFYRSDHVQQAGFDQKNPPKSKDDWVTWMKKLNTPDHFGVGLPASGGTFYLTTFVRDNLWFQNGVRFYSDDLRKCALNTPQAADVLAWMVQLINKENVTSPTIDDVSSDFGKGKVSSYTTGTWQMPQYLKDKVPFFTGPFPKVYATDTVAVTSNMAGVTNIKDHDKVIAGLKYHKWVMQHPSALFDAIGIAPPNKVYSESDEFRKHAYYPYVKPSLDALPTATTYPLHELSTNLFAAESWDVGMQKIFAGKLSPKDGLDAIEKEWNQIISENMKK